MYKIVLATSNPHKVEEINSMVKGLGIEFVLPPEDFKPVETGLTFEENAFIKAKDAHKLTGMPSLADDSGLCVDALYGEPGIHSARYSDTPENRIKKLLDVLKDVPWDKRGAKFVCAMTFLDESGKTVFSDRGECFGNIGFEAKGKNGFGYDPIFILNDKMQTMAEITEKEKNKISHRALVLNKFLNFLNNYKFIK
jgi:XTP/dITP diphosphohydrolase